jgi:hypothetical protein
MTDLWTFGTAVWIDDETTTGAPPDLVGYDVEATDGSIGKIDAATYDENSSHLVVDTGWWIFGKKRMIPAGVVQQVNRADGKVYVSMTKDEIKAAPDFDEMTHVDDTYRSSVGEYYSPWGGIRR